MDDLFTKAEYEGRLHRARTLMSAAGMDALLVTAPRNLTYLTGYRTNLFSSTFRPFTALVPLESDPVLLLPNLEVWQGEGTGWIADVRGWGTGMGSVARDPLELIKIAADEKRVSAGRIGVEQSRGQRVGMTLEQYGQLQRLLPGATWLDSAPLMWDLRVVKSPQEVAYMREACRITDAGIVAALETVREGVTERELQVVMGTTMMREGADTVRSLSIASGPQRYAMLNAPATSRALRPGEMVTFDCGAVYNGYHGDLTRGYFIGEVNDRQRQFYEASLEIFWEAVRAVRPGVTCEDVDRVAEEAIVRRGYREYMLHRTGHSLGMEVHEEPSIGPGVKVPLQPGMVLAVEPGIYDFTIGAFRNEDNVVVTESGCDLLSNAPRELIVR